MRPGRLLSWFTAAMLLGFSFGCEVTPPGAVHPTANVAGTGGVAAMSGEYAVSSPYTQDNLTVFIIKGADKAVGKDFVTLTEAMGKHYVVVHETQDVNNLEIENVSDHDIWVQSGDIVKGGQQDRTFANDCIIPPKSGKVGMAAFCVEHGRWSARGSENVTQFTSSANNANFSSVKMAIQSSGLSSDSSHAQGAVWDEVKKSQEKLAQSTNAIVTSTDSSSSMQLTLETTAVKKSVQPYRETIEKIVASHPDAIGYAAVINGKLATVDIYANHNLFVKLWPKLLDSTCVEAVAEFEQGKTYPAVSSKEIAGLLESTANTKDTANKEVANRAELYQRETDKMLIFDCIDKNAAASPAINGAGGGRAGSAVHRSMVAK